jgi:hypothetical protein
MGVDLGDLTDLVSVLLLAVLALLAIEALRLRGRMRQFDGEAYAVTAPASVGSAEHLFQGLHGLLRPPLLRLLRGQPWVSFELIGRGGEVGLQVWIPTGQRPFIESLLRAAYPGVTLTRVGEPDTLGKCHAAAQARLARAADLPIRSAFDGEPLSGVLWTLARVPLGATVIVQLLVRPRPAGWERRAEANAQYLRDRQRLDKSLFRPTRLLGPSGADLERAKAMEEKAARGFGYDCVLRVSATADSAREARELVNSVGAGLHSFAGENSLRLRSSYLFAGRLRNEVQRRRFPLFGGILLTAPELCGLWHLPSAAPPQLEVVRSPALPAPPGVESGVRALGVTTWGHDARPVRLSIADSRHHLHLLGSTGTGKTTAMLGLAAQDIAAGRGVGVLDPKGDLVHGLLERIPRSRLNDVVLISPDQMDASVGINPLEILPGDDRDLIADNAVMIFKRIYERYWGPRTDDVLKSALVTLLRRPGSTLGHVPLLLTDPAFRMRVLAEVKDAFVLETFWTWFDGLTETQRAEAAGPVLNKLRDFLIRPRLRRLLCQPASTLDLRKVVDTGQILLADLSVGRWGDTTSALVGSFLVARIWQAILARSALPEEGRRDFFLFVDEFQHFLGMSGPFADVLAEARSLRLSLTIANQHLGQLTRDLRDAISSNARSRMVFQCGQEDAAYLAKEFVPLHPDALMSLGRFDTVARLSVEGRSSQPFSLHTTLPPRCVDCAPVTQVWAASARFTRPAEEIDEELRELVRATRAPQAVAGGRHRTA